MHTGAGGAFSLDPSKRSWCDDRPHLQHMLCHPGDFPGWTSGSSPPDVALRSALKTQFDANRLSLIQTRNLTSHELAVLTGASVSPARYFVMHAR